MPKDLDNKSNNSFSQKNPGTYTQTGSALFKPLVDGQTQAINVGVIIATESSCSFKEEMPLDRLLDKTIPGMMT